MKSSERIFVREEESPAPPRDFAAGIDLAASASPPAPAPARAPEITGPVALAEGGFTMPGAVELAEEEEYGTLLDTDIEFYEPMVPERIERVSIEKEPTEPQARWRPALESVFEALVGPAAAPVATRPPPAMTSSFVDDEMFVLDDEIVVFTDEGPAAAPAPVAAAPAPEPGAEDFVADTTMPMRPSAIEEPPAGESPPVEIPPVAAETPVVPEPPAVEAPPPPEPAPAEPRETFTLTAEPASEPFGDEPSPIEVEPTAEAEATPLLPFMQSAAPAAPETPAPPPATVAEKEPRARPLFRRKRPELFAEPATRDPLMDQAAVIFIERGRASVVLLQRRLDIGYTRASRIVESLAKEGLVGPLTESGSREVLMSREEWDRRRGEAAP